MDAEHQGAPGAPAIPPGYRLHNGALVPAEQPAITRIMAKDIPKPVPRRRWVLGGAALLLLVIVAVMVASKHDVARVAPADEKAFLKTVQHGQDRVKHGNAVTLVAARAERGRLLCQLLGPRHQKVHGWVGTIRDIDTRGDNEGVITVSIGHDADLRTGSGDGAEKRTLLRPGSGVFESVAKLHNGERVVLGGTFVRDHGACVKETSVNPKNGMLTPDFLFLFSDIKPA
jgi:hypothetical protein